ncbi:putative Protein phosphatase 2C [Blattamonas nauphoetae]|uniref:PPM-type phosphatase domain-containing protein n=1 Tax=Blattamonas nauphoetae TaxID=2049346 RepID=A0ABQ9XTV8_9EUKA|nr:putative Protein phosphatase 2C [Blattamonas nauphoetae]
MEAETELSDPLLKPILFDYGMAEDLNPRFRRTMEDAHVYRDCFGPKRNLALCAVFDGHGGRETVDFLTQNFHQILNQQLTLNPDLDLQTILRQTFAATDAKLAEYDIIDDGSTAAVVLIERLPPPSSAIRIVSANCGDARSAFIQQDQAFALSKDHKPSDPEEMHRIRESGSFVVQGRACGVLAVSRAFGDHRLKTAVISEPFISTLIIDPSLAQSPSSSLPTSPTSQPDDSNLELSSPSITSPPTDNKQPSSSLKSPVPSFHTTASSHHLDVLSNTDPFATDRTEIAIDALVKQEKQFQSLPLQQPTIVVIACDGVWDVLTCEDVGEIVLGKADNAENAAQELVKETKNHGTTDNVSAMVLFLTPPTTPEYASEHYALREEKLRLKQEEKDRAYQEQQQTVDEDRASAAMFAKRFHFVGSHDKTSKMKHRESEVVKEEEEEQEETDVWDKMGEQEGSKSEEDWNDKEEYLEEKSVNFGQTGKWKDEEEENKEDLDSSAEQEKTEPDGLQNECHSEEDANKIPESTPNSTPESDNSPVDSSPVVRERSLFQTTSSPPVTTDEQPQLSVKDDSPSQPDQTVISATPPAKPQKTSQPLSHPPSQPKHSPNFARELVLGLQPSSKNPKIVFEQEPPKPTPKAKQHASHNQRTPQPSNGPVSITSLSQKKESSNPKMRFNPNPSNPQKPSPKERMQQPVSKQGPGSKQPPLILQGMQVPKHPRQPNKKT